MKFFPRHPDFELGLTWYKPRFYNFACILSRLSRNLCNMGLVRSKIDI